MSVVIENTKPGVTALVNTGQVARPLERQPSSTAFVIGFAIWGPIGVRTVVTSWSEFLRVFGSFHPLGFLADFAYVFFNLFVGRQMIAVRAGGGGAAKASITVTNRAGSPLATFKFDAKYPSSSVDVKVVVTDSTDTSKVNLRITSVALKIDERYTDIDLRTAADVAALNAKSRLVDVSLVAASVAGATGRPAAGTFNLTGGTDGSSGFDVTTLNQYLAQFADENLGTGQVLIPGYSGTANNAALIAHAETYNRMALLDSTLADDASDVIASADLNRSSFAAMYYPWVELQNLDQSGLKKFYPPSMFAAGACAQVDRTIGTHKAPANIKIPLALDVERNTDGTSVINDGVRELLNGKQINVIAPIQGEGIKIYGARVLYPAGETRVRFVHERRMLNLIYYTAKIGYAWAVFAVVDGQGRLFRDLKAAGVTFLRNLYRDGGLYGATEKEAFIVVADTTNNPPDELEQGRVHVQLGVKLSPTAEIIFINIDSVPLSQDLSVLQS